jgi:multidrug efflux pump
MVPFNAIRQQPLDHGPSQLQRYNGVESMKIQGQGAPGKSSGEAMAAMEELMKQAAERDRLRMDRHLLQQQQSGSQAPLLYALSILVVFLCLAALYESWSIPVSVIMVVPLGVLGALGDDAVRPVERRVLPGRPAHDDRPVGQERDPDRRIRPRTPGRGAPKRWRPSRSGPACGCGRS